MSEMNWEDNFRLVLPASTVSDVLTSFMVRLVRSVIWCLRKHTRLNENLTNVFFGGCTNKIIH